MNNKCRIVVLWFLITIMILPVSVFAEHNTTAKHLDPTGKYYVDITLDGYTYYDVGGGTKVVMNDTVIGNIVKEKLIPNWVDIANGCFRDAGDCATLDSYRYAEVFNNGGAKDDCFGEIREYLRGVGKNKGSKKHDSLSQTGIKIAGSLGEVRQEMVNSVIDNIDRYALDKKRSKFMELGPEVNKENKILPEMDDSKSDTVVYSIATSINQKSSLEYIYNSFGICFYDFHPCAIQADDLEYKTALDGYKSVEEAKEKGAPGVELSDEKKNEYGAAQTNSSAKPASYSLSYQNGTTESFTNYTENSSTKSYGQTININSKWGGDTMPLGIWLTEIDVGASFSFEEMYSSTEGHSKTESHDNVVTTETSVDVEPHTSVMLKSATSNATLTTDYDTPVMVSYKVMIFSITGHLYADSVATCTFYGHGNYLNKVGSDTAEFGSSAMENLNQRAILNTEPKRKDTAFGAVVHKYIHETGNNNDDVQSGVDWSSGFLNDDAVTKAAVLNQAKNGPMLSCGCKYVATIDTIESDINDHVPLYLPAKFTVKPADPSYKMTTGEKMNLSAQLELGCENRYEVPYYGFSPSDGRWVTCDIGGNVVTDSCVSIQKTGTGAEILTADSAGKAYITWKMNEDVVYKADKDKGKEITYKDKLPSPLIEIDVQSEPFEGSVKVEGTFEGCVGDEGLNLNKIMTAKVYDTHDKQVSKPVEWVARELPESGIEVDTDGTIRLTKEGTFHIAAVVRNTGSGAEDIYSPWVEIKADQKRELTKIYFSEQLESTKQIHTDKCSIHQIDLLSYLRGEDQYGDPWEGDFDDVTFELSDNAENAVIKDNMLQVTNEDAFTVTAGIEGLDVIADMDMVFVEPYDIKDAEIVLAESALIYNGEEQSPVIASVKAEGEQELTEGTDYKVTYPASKDAGQYLLTFEGIGAYKGKATALYRINSADISKAKVTGIKNAVYTGKAIKKVPIVKLGGVTLKKDTDYTVAYKDEKAVGGAKVYITGKGSCHGRKTICFNILPKKAKISDIAVGKKKITVKMSTKISKTGGRKYEIQYRIKGQKKWKTKITKKQSLVLKKLKKNKRYQVRVRAFKKADGGRFDGAWSKIKTSRKVK